MIILLLYSREHWFNPSLMEIEKSLIFPFPFWNFYIYFDYFLILIQHSTSNIFEIKMFSFITTSISEWPNLALAIFFHDNKIQLPQYFMKYFFFLLDILVFIYFFFSFHRFCLYLWLFDRKNVIHWFKIHQFQTF